MVGAGSGTEPLSEEQLVAALEDEWLAAEVAHDEATPRRVIDDRHTMNLSDGTTPGKDEYIARGRLPRGHLATRWSMFKRDGPGHLRRMPSAELAGPLRGRRGFVPGQRAELGHGVRDMDTGGLLADEQAITDLSVGVPLRHEAQDVAFACGQR